MMGGRSSWATALAVAMMWMLATAGPAGAAGGASVTTVPDGPLFGELVPGPDGRLWHAEYLWRGYESPGDTRVMRVGPDGTSVTTLSYWPLSGIEPHVLPDGSMGLVGETFDERIDAWVADGRVLLRLDADSGAVASETRLPYEDDETTAFAFAPDGAVWFADSCNDRLGRVAPNGRLTYVRLPRIGCREEGGTVERGARLTFDSKGALWFVNLCVGRIDRMSLAGRVREWHTLRVGCDSWEGVRTAVAADPRGGVFFTASGSDDYGSGRVHRGRLQRFAFSDDGVFTPDGALWRVVSGGIERRGPDGSATIVRGTGRVRPVSNLVPAHDGGVAAVLATYWRSDPNTTSHDPPVHAFLDGQVVAIRPGGGETSWPLPDGETDASSQLSSAYVALGPDGAFYVRENRVAGPDYARSARLLRLLPDEQRPPTPPSAHVSTVLGRVGRVAWLHLSCEAELARFCVGTVRLTGTGVAPARARFALAGRSRAAVPITLGGRALRVLRQRGKVRMFAEVRTDDGTVTRSRVTIGSNVPR